MVYTYFPGIVPLPVYLRLDFDFGCFQGYSRSLVKEAIDMEDEVLKVRDLNVKFYTYAGVVKALEGISFDIKDGETFGIVGETGCGKSVTALSLLRLVPSPGEIQGGELKFKRDGKYEDIMNLDEDELRRIRGNEISMIFQEPSDALNPVYTIGDQISESFLAHRKEEMIKKVIEQLEEEINSSSGLKKKLLGFEVSIFNKMLKDPDSWLLKLASKIPILNRYENRLDEEARKRSIKILEEVGIPDPEGVAEKYPHEMSGGMNQRAVISIALACNPRLLIADEPTSNLDVSIQRRILDIIDDMKEEFGISVLHITHNLGVVAENCDRVGVMYAGEIIEIAEVDELFDNPLHPYTQMLLGSVPSSEKDKLPEVEGSVPDLISPPSGCRFNPRCPWSEDVCEKSSSSLKEVKENHYVACRDIEVEKNEQST